MNTAAAVAGARARGHAVAVAAAALGALAAVLWMLPLIPSMPAPGSEASWPYTLNEAVARRLAFGRDFVFTFGPLGSAYTQLYHPATDALMLGSAAVLALGLCAGFALVALPRRRALLVALPCVLALTQARDAIFMMPALLLVLGALRCTDADVDADRHGAARAAAFVAVAAAAGVLPLVKGSFAVVAAVETAIAVLLLIRARRFALAALVVAAAATALVAGWCGAGQALADLPGFFASIGPIVSGYTEAMALAGPDAATAAWLAAAAALVALAWLLVARRRGRLRGGLAWAGICLYLFVNFKAGFVRQDAHMLIAGSALVLAALALAAFVPARAGLGFLLLGAAGWIATERASMPFGWRDVPARLLGAARVIGAGLERRLATPGVLAAEFANANAALRGALALPALDGGADTYPAGQSYLFAHGVAWAGRPLPMSYAAYRPQLDAANAAHLAGAAAPAHVLLSVESIDAQLPTQEDASSWPILLTAYDVVERVPPFLHLRRARERAPAPRALGEVDARLGASVEVPAAAAVVAGVDMRPTPVGRLALAAFRLPPVGIELTLESGRTLTLHYIPGMCRNGFLLSPLLLSADDLLALLAGVDVGTRVVRLRIVADETFWRPDLHVRFAALALDRHDAARALLGIDAPAASVPDAILAPGAEPADCSVDAIGGGRATPARASLARGAVRIQGWAAPAARAGLGPEEIWAVLTPRAGAPSYYRLRVTPRPDVDAFFARPELGATGFDARLDLRGLAGTYALELRTLRGGAARRCTTSLSVAVE
ncbi:MAG TPA: hypothetical protein VGC30_05395 [Dokdonella sp.]